MQRSMTGFHQDEQGDWVAELSCGHGQHVRHKPPFQVREWVCTPEGRAKKIGLPLECVRCDRRELPEGYVPYKRTDEFTESTIPAGLLRDHSLKTGTWGRLIVLEGELIFTVVNPTPPAQQTLTPEASGVIPPEVVHFVTPDGPVRFVIEFCGRP